MAAEPARGARGTALERSVRGWQVTCLALNDVIGSGIYLLPAAAAALLGTASLGAVFLAGLAVLLVVLCFAEASTYFDQPGGAYLYARAAFGELAGFQVGWMTWLARVASVASLAAGFAQALEHLWPAAAGGWARAILVTVPVLLLTLLNVLGVRQGVGAAVALLGAKLVPLAVFLGGGLLALRLDVFRAQAPLVEGSPGEAALLLLFAYAGFENTPAAAGEYRDPRRDVPRALLIQILVVTLLYAGVQAVALATLPRLGASQTPLASAAGRFLGPWAGVLLTVGAALSILGTKGNTVLVGPRYLFALARAGFGPRILARIHPRFRTPVPAILLQTALALPLALTGSFVALAALSVVARLATYLGTAAAVPVLRRRRRAPPGSFRLPGTWLVPGGALLLSLALLASAEASALAAAGLAVVAGMAVFLLRRPAGEDQSAP